MASLAVLTGVLMIAFGVQGVAAIDTRLEAATAPTPQSLEGEGVVRTAEPKTAEQRRLCAEWRRQSREREQF